MAHQKVEGLIVMALLDQQEATPHANRIAVHYGLRCSGKQFQAPGRVAKLRVDFVKIDIKTVVGRSKLYGFGIEPCCCLSIPFDPPGVNAQVAVKHRIIKPLAQGLKPELGRILVAAVREQEIAQVILRMGIERIVYNRLGENERIGKPLGEHLIVRGRCGLRREALGCRCVLPGPRVGGEVVVEKR